MTSSSPKRGVVLAGGQGTRLRPLTYVANKHLLPVYDKPMIYYPIETLRAIGCEEIILISGGENLGGFADLLQDGSRLGVSLTYRVQNEAGGIAQALLAAEGLVDGVFPVILGDNYLSITPTVIKPSIYVKAVPDPQRFGVYANGRITEKPSKSIGNQAVIGFYVYNSEVFEFIKSLTPSARGEYEITDVNNWYLDRGATVTVYDGFWSDMGTFPSLLEVATYEANRRAD